MQNGRAGSCTSAGDPRSLNHHHYPQGRNAPVSKNMRARAPGAEKNMLHNGSNFKFASNEAMMCFKTVNARMPKNKPRTRARTVGWSARSCREANDECAASRTMPPRPPSRWYWPRRSPRRRPRAPSYAMRSTCVILRYGSRSNVCYPDLPRDAHSPHAYRSITTRVRPGWS